jgi:hypothetical protein
MGYKFLNNSRRERGYVLSLMTILVLTIVGIGLFVGLYAVRDAWFKKSEFQRSLDVQVLYDQDGTPGGPAIILGKAVDFDEHETPLIPFVDYAQTYNGQPVNYRALIGVRDVRFTSEERVYYTSNNCSSGGGNVACVFVPSSEGHAARHGVSYQQATQAGSSIAAGVPQKTYAVGQTETQGDGQPGWLWRQTDDDCPIGVNTDINSSWHSKSLAPLSIDSCESEDFYVDVTTLALRCQDSPSGGNCTTATTMNPAPALQCDWEDAEGDTDGSGVFDGGVTETPIVFCGCPTGYSEWPIGNGSGWCCPDGTNSGGAGQCQQIANNLPANGTFKIAEPVELSGQNIFDNFIPNRPFTVNTPLRVDTSFSSGEILFDNTEE